MNQILREQQQKNLPLGRISYSLPVLEDGFLEDGVSVIFGFSKFYAHSRISYGLEILKSPSLFVEVDFLNRLWRPNQRPSGLCPFVTIKGFKLYKSVPLQISSAHCELGFTQHSKDLPDLVFGFTETGIRLLPHMNFQNAFGGIMLRNAYQSGVINVGTQFRSRLFFREHQDTTEVSLNKLLPETSSNMLKSTGHGSFSVSPNMVDSTNLITPDSLLTEYLEQSELFTVIEVSQTVQTVINTYVNIATIVLFTSSDLILSVCVYQIEHNTQNLTLKRALSLVQIMLSPLFANVFFLCFLHVCFNILCKKDIYSKYRPLIKLIAFVKKLPNKNLTNKNLNPYGLVSSATTGMSVLTLVLTLSSMQKIVVFFMQKNVTVDMICRITCCVILSIGARRFFYTWAITSPTKGD